MVYPSQDMETTSLKAKRWGWSRSSFQRLTNAHWRKCAIGNDTKGYHLQLSMKWQVRRISQNTIGNQNSRAEQIEHQRMIQRRSKNSNSSAHTILLYQNTSLVTTFPVWERVKAWSEGFMGVIITLQVSLFWPTPNPTAYAPMIS